MLRFPKTGKKPKKAWKPIARTRIRPGKTHFVDYLTKRFSWVIDSYQIPAWAIDEANRRRASPTPQEALVAQFLTRHGIRYEREKVWANGPKPITSDFWLPDHHQTLEVDGSQHKLNATYDRKRTMFLATHYRVGTIRLTNAEVDHGYAWDRLKQMLGLNSPPNQA